MDDAHRRCQKLSVTSALIPAINDIAVLSGSIVTGLCLLSCLSERCSITSRVTRHTNSDTMLFSRQNDKQNALFYASWTRDSCIFIKDLSLRDLYGLLYTMDSF